MNGREQEDTTVASSALVRHVHNVYTIDLGEWASNETLFYSDEQLTVTLGPATELSLDFYNYQPTPENVRRVAAPLCRHIANLGRNTNYHPLLQIAIYGVDLECLGMSDIFELFLIVAKHIGIRELVLSGIRGTFPIQFLVEFCRDNSNLKVLSLHDLTFSDTTSSFPTMALPQNDARPQHTPAALPSLNVLAMTEIEIETATAKSIFENCVVAHNNVGELELGWINCWAVADTVPFKMPSAEHLILKGGCVNLPEVLEAGRATVTSLYVYFECDHWDTTERLELLANFIRDAVRLQTLRIENDSSDPQVSPPPQFLQAVEACATVTTIDVDDFDPPTFFSPEVEQQLEAIAWRNRDLARLVASPSTYPIGRLPSLMLRLGNCPTGRYMLARCLPGMVSFESVKSMEPDPKKRRIA